MDSDRDAGGVIVGSAVPGSLAGVRLNRSISSDEFYAVVNVSKGNHVLYIHGHSTGGGDTLVTLAIAAQ